MLHANKITYKWETKKNGNIQTPNGFEYWFGPLILFHGGPLISLHGKTSMFACSFSHETVILMHHSKPIKSVTQYWLTAQVLLWKCQRLIFCPYFYYLQIKLSFTTTVWLIVQFVDNDCSQYLCYTELQNYTTLPWHCSLIMTNKRPMRV